MCVPLVAISWRRACHTAITHLLSTTLASCNLKNGFRRFVPHICNNISSQRPKKKMIIVIHFIASRSFFYRDLLLAAWYKNVR